MKSIYRLLKNCCDRIRGLLFTAIGIVPIDDYEEGWFQKEAELRLARISAAIEKRYSPIYMFRLNGERRAYVRPAYGLGARPSLPLCCTLINPGDGTAKSLRSGLVPVADYSGTIHAFSGGCAMAAIRLDQFNTYEEMAFRINKLAHEMLMPSFHSRSSLTGQSIPQRA